LHLLQYIEEGLRLVSNSSGVILRIMYSLKNVLPSRQSVDLESFSYAFALLNKVIDSLRWHNMGGFFGFGFGIVETDSPVSALTTCSCLGIDPAPKSFEI